MKFTEKEMQTIETNLKTGKCPNCGSEEKKIVFPESIDLNYTDGSYQTILAQCPHCGYILLFSKEFIMK